MVNKTIAFIGAGNMAEAIIGGIISLDFKIIASDTDKQKLDKMKMVYKIDTFVCNKKVVVDADIVFLSIKPNIYSKIIKEVRDVVKRNAIIIIIAAGQGIETVSKQFNRNDLKIVKAMPNMPSLVQESMTAICPSDMLDKEEINLVLDIFKTIGRVELLEENLFDAFTAVAGSAPAYAFMFIEAMADAGVKHGLSRKDAVQFSAQTLLGSAKMILKTNEHPAKLRDNVASPGGTTIEAICELEKEGFRNAIIKAISLCVEKSKKMGSNE